MKTVILVPRREDGGERDRLWRFCRARWEAGMPDWPIIEGHHDADEGPFNRAAAINRAAREAGEWDVAIVIDADVIVSVEQARDAANLARKSGRLTLAYRVFKGLRRNGTERILTGYTGSWEPFVRMTLWNSCSLCIAVPHTLWDRVGGFDERFCGWGWEDVGFAHACDTLGGERHRVDGDVWHLWHHTTPERTRRPPQLYTNQALATRYSEAHDDEDAMLAILSEPGAPLSKVAA